MKFFVQGLFIKEKHIPVEGIVQSQKKTQVQDLEVINI